MAGWLKRLIDKLMGALVYGQHARYRVFLDKERK